MPMNWTSVRKFYGFERPYDFSVAIPFLLNVCMVILIVVVCAFLFGVGNLNIGTERFYFFAYIICLLLIAAALSRSAALSYALLCWCTIELGLAFASNLSGTYAAGASLFPRNIVTAPADRRFMYHPLLQIAPRPNYEYEWLRKRDKDSNPRLNWKYLQGRDLKFHHNSLGLRGRDLTAEDLARDFIFVYGGSTTYDVAVTQGETWVERLQSDLKNKYTLLNFGVIAHSTAEHLIETAFYQDPINKRPVCALYYVGWNDIINAHIEKLDGAYANHHALLEAGINSRPDLYLAKYSPVVRLLNDIAKDRFNTIPKPAEIRGPPVGGSDEHLESIFAEHIKTIAAINESRGTKTVFIAQILNKDFAWVPDRWGPLVKSEDLLPLQERFNSLLEKAAIASSAKYIDAGSTNFGKDDFVDMGHFTSSGTAKFAALISGEVDSYCR